MAILTKKDYSKRNENASKRNAANTETAVANGLPREIGENIKWLCNRRHWFHCLDVASVYNSESFEYVNFYHFVQKENDEIIKLEEYFNKPVFTVSQLTIEALPTDYDWNECLDDEEKENIYDDDEEKYRLESLSKIMDFKNNINNQIEKFLTDIDAQFKTSYAPWSTADLLTIKNKGGTTMNFLPTPLKPKLEIGMDKDQKIMAYIPKHLKLHVQSCFHDSDGYWVHFDGFVWNTLCDGASVCEDTIKELKATLKCCKVCGIQDKPIKLQGFSTDMYCLDYDKNVLAHYQVNSIVVYGFGCELTLALNINDDKALIDLIAKSKYFEFKHTHKKFKLENKTVNMNNSIAYFDFAEIVL